MTCEEFGGMLDNYENLTDEEKLSMNEHASQCAHCREELDFMLAIIAQLNTLPKIQTPSDFGAELNRRLDLEKANGFGRMLNSVRRNYGRYSTAAACLVLAVIIGANGKTLMNGMRPAEDNRATVENTDDRSAGTEQSIAAEFAQKEQAMPAQAESADGNNESVPVNAAAASVQTAKAEGTAAQTYSGADSRIKPIQKMSESINQIGTNSAEKVQAPVYEGLKPSNDEQSAGIGRSIADEAAAVNTASAQSASSHSDNYTIARGIYRLPDPEIAEKEAPSVLNNGVLQISEINEQAEATIAKGRYYIPADDGYIAIDSSNELGVNGEDAERAAELIQQYADIRDDSYYVINSENIPSMLEHMDGEGIDYKNNMENAENEKVSFKLVIE